MFVNKRGECPWLVAWNEIDLRSQMTEKPTKKEMYTEIGLSHDRGPSRDTGKEIVASRTKRVKLEKN